MKQLLKASMLALLLALPVTAQEEARSSLQVTADEDGDVAVVMDTESIRMTVLPAYQACISSFIFKPTGNDILARQSVKMIKAGSGLLQDNFWEQDWRFSEFRRKWYDFQILSQGPEELAVKFWTTSVGWLQSDESGVISDLISNIKIERTVRMPAGKPYFLCDVELSIDMSKEDEKGNAKLPQFWVHNSSLFTDDLSDEYQRPHILGIAEQTKQGRTVSTDYVYTPNLAEGWSAHTSPASKEGIVYLMDPAYVQSLYNCGNGTLEWFGDNMLITRRRPLKTRIYILPVIGLDKVHFADPHMILRLLPEVVEDGPRKGQISLQVAVSPSYKRVKRISFEAYVTYGLHEREHVRAAIEPIPVVRNLRVESPRRGVGYFKRLDGGAFNSQTPVLFDLTAHIEVVDDDSRIREKKVTFQHFHLGNYPTGKNEHLQGGEPLASLDRVDARPWIPTPDRDLAINRQAFRIFLLAGMHAWHYRSPDALAMARTRGGQAASWDRHDDTGYTFGYPYQATGLSNFPYDFERLFQYRALINCNSQSDVLRLVGQSILTAYFRRGGGYITFGGESAYRVTAPVGHALNAFEPVVFTSQSIAITEPGKPAQLIATMPDHPIFKGDGEHAPAIDLNQLPQTLSYHRLQLKTTTAKPFIADPHEQVGLLLESLPAETRTRVESLDAARLVPRQQIATDLYGRMSEHLQQQLQATWGKLFPDHPDGIRTGVADDSARQLMPLGQAYDLRVAFVDFGDDEKELLNQWLDANFGRPNRLDLRTVAAVVRDQVVALLEKALADTGVFRSDSSLLILPEDAHPALIAILTTGPDELPRVAQPSVLLEVVTAAGEHYPFLVETVWHRPVASRPDELERDTEAGRFLAFINTPFGDVDKYPDAVPYWQWSQWPQLVANAIMYASGEL